MLRISSPRNQAVIMIELAEPGLPRRREAGTPLDAATPPRFPVGLADAGPGLGSTTRQVRTAQLAGPGPFPTAGGSTAPSREAAAFEKGTTHVYRRRNDHRDRAHRGCHHVLPQALTRTFPHSRSPTYVKNLRSRTPGVRYVHPAEPVPRRAVRTRSRAWPTLPTRCVPRAPPIPLAGRGRSGPGSNTSHRWTQGHGRTGSTYGTPGRRLRGNSSGPASPRADLT
jgi:hypothetical protein